jgi:predicted permease
VGAGLLGKSLYLLLRVDIGMQPDHLATLQVDAPTSVYSKDALAVALGRQIVSRVEALPGVRSAAIASVLPVRSEGNTAWIRFLDRPYNGEHNEMPNREVSSGYFTTVGAKLLRGRYFTDDEDASKPRVVVVNQEMVRQYFPGGDALGKQISYLTAKLVPMEIVGVVENIKEGQLDSKPHPVVYIPFNQDPGNDFALLVRTSQSEQSLITTLASTIREINPAIATSAGATMRELINDSPSAYLRRSSAWLVGAFAAAALLLSIVGLYGVISYSVSQRRREIGVRMALGAQPGNVYSMVLKEAGWLAAAGIGTGLLCSIASASLMRGLLFGVRSWDVPTLVAVAGLLGISALLASYIPARRAASVNPVEVLRAE